MDGSESSCSWDYAEELIHKCMQSLDGEPPAGFLSCSGIREQMLWLMENEARYEKEIRHMLADFFSGEQALEASNSVTRWLLYWRFWSCGELMWELPALDLRKWVEKDIKEKGLHFLAQWMIQGWPIRAEGSWLRVCARMVSGQIWVDENKMPGG